ncbi:MAG: anhydro-N-acetylmuramic acid kinase [Bacteroidales bacterium]|nr:anhydro-N-acetylmuramic acid kinase [Bacteroidales bacterium]
MEKQHISGEISILGLMSGTSLDGLDLALCVFSEANGKYQYRIEAAETVSYSNEWLSRLRMLPEANAMEYAYTHTAYGRLLGELSRDFLKRNGLSANYIGSHGHTIFHQPGRGFTSQIGEGAALAQASGITVICDFRSGDVARGGQGAPLVPIGDELLFGDYDYCLNIGGFANISYKQDGKRIAFDVGPANIALNKLAQKLGLAYDDEGRVAASGMLNTELLEKLNDLEYYRLSPPKSLGREWVDTTFTPLLNESIPAADLLRTVTEHIAVNISRCASFKPEENMLITGGGTLNTYLIDRIRSLSNINIQLPDKQIIDFKEALIFAFLAYLRILERPNSLSSVTGATSDSCTGCIYLP